MDMRGYEYGEVRDKGRWMVAGLRSEIWPKECPHCGSGRLRGNSELALHDWIVRWKIAAGHLRTLVTTVSRWELEIATYLHTGRPDGPAEAVNRKIFLASQNRLRLY